jgi:hypothetical protein
MDRPKLEVADVFRRYGEAYRQTSLKSGLRVKISRRFNSFGSGFLKPE